MTFAAGKRAKGECDRCGHTKLLNDLLYETQDQMKQTMRVCSSCFDPDHPQWRIKAGVVDYEALRDPRPDRKAERSTQWGWRPVMGVSAVAELGEVVIQ